MTNEKRYRLQKILSVVPGIRFLSNSKSLVEFLVAASAAVISLLCVELIVGPSSDRFTLWTIWIGVILISGYAAWSAQK